MAFTVAYIKIRRNLKLGDFRGKQEIEKNNNMAFYQCLQQSKHDQPQWTPLTR